MSSVRSLGDTVRDGARGIGDARARVRLDGYWMVLAAAGLAVFAGSFAIGHATHSASSTVGEAPSTLHAESLQVPIPIALGGAAPIQTNAALEAIAAANQRASEAPSAPPISIRASLRTSSSSGQATSGEALNSTTSSASTTSSTAEPVHVEPVHVEPVHSTPAPSPVESAPAPAAPSKSAPSHSSGGGPSFDSSE
jgi:hypothetical protein